jgi:polygalacturonase
MWSHGDLTSYIPIYALSMLLIATTAPNTVASHNTFVTLSVTDYGADTTGATLSTKPIQKAIDEVNKRGGGTVLVPPGRYLVTSLRLKSGVTLRIERNAELIASPHQKDYSHRIAIIQGVNASHVAIEGQGAIDGGGDHFFDPKDRLPVSGNRPSKILSFTDCTDLFINGITLKNSVDWTCKLTNCERAVVSDVTIRNPPGAERRRTDGIDIICCRYILVERCDIETGDDAICLKSFLGNNVPIAEHPPMHDILIRNCTVASTSNATKIGTETVGEIRDVIFERITVRKHPQAEHGNPMKSGACIAAISIQSNDGADVHHISYRRYTIEHCGTPIFLLLQDRDSHVESDLGYLHDIEIDDITCKRSDASCQINVCEGAKIGNVILSNLNIHNFEHEHTTQLPPHPSGGYPDAHRYGSMPAYGLFARNVNSLTLKGNINFYDDGGSGREKLVLENVSSFISPDYSCASDFIVSAVVIAIVIGIASNTIANTI